MISYFILGVVILILIGTVVFLKVKLNNLKRQINKSLRRQNKLQPTLHYWPQSKRNKFKTNFMIYAHRGLSNYATENTVPAIELACIAGVNAIEVDVNVTKDNVPVLIHDRNLVSLSHQNLYVRDIKWNELKKIRLIPANKVVPLQYFLENYISRFESILLDFKNPHNEFNRQSVDCLYDVIIKCKAKDRCIADTRNLNVAKYLAGKGLKVSLREPEIPLSGIKKLKIEHISLSIESAQNIFKGDWYGLKVIIICYNDVQNVKWAIENKAYGVVTDCVEETLMMLN